MTLRKAGAPRLIEWTGERCVPWSPDVQIVYEHYHRYAWARDLVAGRAVLDIGSGEGFGAALLAQTAAAVTGIDVDETTVDHARLNYASPTLDFHVGTATDLGRFEDASLGAVVAFEVIEHFAEQDRALGEIKRVLGEDGILVVSTPDRHVYSDATGQNNPFHVRELSAEEFRGLLRAEFAHVATFGQRAITGSLLRSEDPADASPGREVFIERSGDEWLLSDDQVAMYVIAVASQAPLPELPATSTLADAGLALLAAEPALIDLTRREAELRRALVRAHDELLARDVEIGRLCDEIAELTAAGAREGLALEGARATLEERDEEIRRLRVRLRRILESPPAQAYERLRELPGMRALAAWRTESYKAEVSRGAKLPDER